MAGRAVPYLVTEIDAVVAYIRQVHGIETYSAAEYMAQRTRAGNAVTPPPAPVTVTNTELANIDADFAALENLTS